MTADGSWAQERSGIGALGAFLYLQKAAEVAAVPDANEGQCWNCIGLLSYCRWAHRTSTARVLHHGAFAHARPRFHHGHRH
jgi:hypothetical protein